MRLVLPVRLAALLVAGVFSFEANPALAEDTGQTSASGKGIVGGALLGAEAVMLTEALLQVKPPWAYIVGGLAGGIGGGVGGYFAEQEDARVSLGLLAGGFALVIPTTVAVLSATSYQPPQDYTQDRPPVEEPVAEPAREGAEPVAGEGNGAGIPASGSGTEVPAAGGAAVPSVTPSSPAPTPAAAPTPAPAPAAPPKVPGATSPQGAYRPALPPPAVLGLRAGRLSFGVPAVEVAPTFSRRELAIYGVEQRTELRVPVFIAAF